MEEANVMISRDGEAVKAIKDIFGGTVGGIAQVLVGQPFDTVKVRLQTQPTPKPGQPPLYSNMLDCVRKTSKEGFGAFYKGTLTPLVGIGACVSIQFAVVGYMRRYYGEKNKDPFLTNPQLYISGATAGLVNSVISGPVEHIRTRLQIQVTSKQPTQTQFYSGPIDCIKKIYSSYGIRGIYKGQVITMIREFQGFGGYFFVYEYLLQRAMIEGNKKRDQVAKWKLLLFGATAGFGMWIPVYPIDVVKSKLQTDGFTSQTRQYKSAIDCFAKIYRNEGVKGFFKGFGACMLRAAPVNASTFVAYELAMRAIDKL
ncbi:mitochondrial carrier [Gigaspora margarita]|uniref:Mitochondrial carrier n=1 Tax=Gigaspora margarita TaxID=4874 RepID=A0A8H3XJH0_GIGMA|nr:mitochondrial carrier [Gigaspora margarita]